MRRLGAYSIGRVAVADMGNDYIIARSNRPIYAYIKSRNEILKYNDPTFGMALLIFHGENGVIALGENELKNYDCEIIDLIK